MVGVTANQTPNLKKKVDCLNLGVSGWDNEELIAIEAGKYESVAKFVQGKHGLARPLKEAADKNGNVSPRLCQLV